MQQKEQPNPGSIEAVDKGCTCPIMDNSHGKGAMEEEGELLFWMDTGCPLHGDQHG